MMNKFYVQSGSHSWIVQSKDAEGAALWLLDQSIGPFQPGVDFQPATLNSDTLFQILDGLAQLDSEMNVSQVGFGRHEAGLFDTGELFNTWRSLSGSLNSLFDQFN